jgi:hypothetical protein
MTIDDAEVVDYLVDLFLPTEHRSIEEAESFAKLARDGALAYCYRKQWTKETAERIAEKVRHRVEWRLTEATRGSGKKQFPDQTGHQSHRLVG